MHWLVLLAVVVLILAFFAKRGKDEQQDPWGLADFTPSISFNSGTKDPSVAIDAARNKFAVSYPRRPIHIFDFSSLVSVEVLRDGQTITQTNRSSQVASAAVGAVLLGPLGLLLGGLTGKKRSKTKLTRLSLKLFTNDLVRPSHEIVFLDAPKGVLATSPAAISSSKQLDDWYGRFQTVLRTMHHDR
jgi:hypothetical protein